MKKAAIIALINSDNKVLFQLRDNKPEIAYPNYWGLIGGTVEMGETELDGIKREIFEEINLNIKPIKKIGSFYSKKDDILICMFIGKLDKMVEEINLSEGQKIEFFSFDEIKLLKTPEIIRELMLQYREEILGI